MGTLIDYWKKRHKTARDGEPPTVYPAGYFKPVKDAADRWARAHPNPYAPRRRKPEQS